MRFGIGCGADGAFCTSIAGCHGLVLGSSIPSFENDSVGGVSCLEGTFFRRKGFVSGLSPPGFNTAGVS